MSPETWHFSFAKYLEMRIYGHAYCRRLIPGDHHRDCGTPAPPSCACSHPLHTEHFHYFGSRNLVASFKYTQITLNEIVLAQPAIEISPEFNFHQKLFEEASSISGIGLGLHASIGEWLRALMIDVTGTKLESSLVLMVDQQLQEKMHFRTRAEEMMAKLKELIHHDVGNSPGRVEESLWNVADHQVLLKHIIADTVSNWNSRLQEAIVAKKKEEKSSASKISQRTSQCNEAEPVEVKNKEPPPTFAISPNSSREDSGNPVAVTTGELSRKTSDSHQSSPSLSSSPNNGKSPFLRNRSSSDFPVYASPLMMETSQADPSDSRRRSITSNTDANDEVKTPLTPLQNRLSLNALLANAGPGNPPLTSPFPTTEHHSLPPSSSIPLVVYQNEPSSIIAYALASVDYEHQLADLQADLADQAIPSPPRTSSPVGPDRWFDNVEREEPGGKVSGPLAAAQTGGPSTSAPLVGPLSSNHHLEIQFSDQSTKFYCRVYYAEQFRLLRSKVFPAGEERFIRSLSRCVPWAASGGKSGSTFCKTNDDRFVLKQMSKMEIQSFVDLAPNYITYTQRALRDNRPTAFCKIVGAFRIVFKNVSTNVASKQDLLVMENLFYNRKVSKKFDLKGSERNRLVSASEAGVDDCVLLDENFSKMIWDNPLYIRGYSQGVLIKALNADTQFLASQLVMDYSLLVGIDEKNNELIVGLIDYIRTFTWDKRLETFVKSSGILGGQGKMPTVVSPELYRTRFCEAMNRYFTAVPSFWE